MTESTRRPSVGPKKTARPATAAGGFPERGLKIGEAAAMLGVETYVLRFWETQFPFLKPKHSKTKHRFYHERDIEVLRLIKRILHDEGFTIAGANKYIKEVGLDTLLKGGAPPKAVHAEDHASKQAPAEGSTKRVLSEVRRDLENLHKLLED
jgi:DNA-binding transcriptional MerR regulator